MAIQFGSVPAFLVGDERDGLDREVEGADVPDVLLDDELELEHDHDHAGRLEEAVVVPLRVLARQQRGDPVVLPEEQRVQDRAADRGVAVLETDREDGVLALLRGAAQDRVDHEPFVEEAVELGLEGQRSARLPLLEEEHRELLAVDLLALEPAAAHGAQHARLVRPQPVDLAQVDLLGRGVLAEVVPAGAQEAVGEPLREEHEPDAGVGRLDLTLRVDRGRSRHSRQAVPRSSRGRPVEGGGP